MGEVAILRPQDFLYKNKRINYPDMKSRRNQNFNPIPKPNPSPNSARSNRRRRSPTKNNNSQTPKNLVMGQVKILKRGETLNVVNDEIGDVEDVMLSSTNRLGPEPDMVPKKATLADFYAGSAFFDSPPPSSVPLPAFFMKKNDPTTDLRRLLGLHLP